ncbi:ABC transporter substrate-binding protein [Flavisphingomonas formosensis]|uniref:ABC transporter substrate-binding protein n=1 Tax=Flavisphingomonas formosensis TaxID=861534 RepID=UPI0012FAC503|nr:ABC transporter substrate-binding protein [Sphingomonas formosensis]
MDPSLPLAGQRVRSRRAKWWKSPWVIGVTAVATVTAVMLVRNDKVATEPPRNMLRIAMTAGDLPTTTGAPTQGLEGVRFAGYPVFEPLTMWDLRVTDRPPGVIPWLATDWAADQEDHNKWTFHLRQGVRFHDGSTFDADAVIWNFQRLYDKRAPQYEETVAAGARARAPMIDRWEKIDSGTVAIYTKTPTSFFPEIIASILMVSPARWRAVGGNWAAFGERPSGTGAFRITKVDKTSITMDRNPGYWNVRRAAKLDRVQLFAMAEPTTRIAALRSGEVDWIEGPPTDAISFLRSQGYTVSTSPMAHIWAYWLKIAPTSPFRDLRVRQAFNFAMDRQGVVKILNGAAQSAKGYWKPADARFGHPQNDYAYNPAKSLALLKASGYPVGVPVRVKVMLIPSGSGMMLSQPMNELLQQSAGKAGFDLTFETVDFNQAGAIMLNPGLLEARGFQAITMGFDTSDLTWFYYSFYPPNVVGFEDKTVMRLLDQYRTDFSGDEAARNAMLARVHERLVDLAPWVWVVHDVNPRAFSPKVKGYTPSQSWFTDLTTVYIDEGSEDKVR